MNTLEIAKFKDYAVSQEVSDFIEMVLCRVEMHVDKEAFSFSIQWNEKVTDTFRFFCINQGWQLFENDGSLPLKGYQKGLRGENSLEKRLYFLAWEYRWLDHEFIFTPVYLGK